MALDGGRFDAATTRMTGLLGAARTGFGEVQHRVAAGRARVSALAPTLPAWLQAAVSACRRDGPVRRALVAWFNRQPLVKFISRSLLRRIVVSNLLGFVILFAGIVYLSLNSSWLINAKREALRIQGEIIAAAIAGDAKVVKNQIVVDPDRLPAGNDALIPFRDDAFASLELSIRPEVVGPMIKRLTRPTNTRARILDRSGNLVVDSESLLSRGQIVDPGTSDAGTESSERPKTKNFWTRLRYWLIGKEVQVYRDIGATNAQHYPEVREALKGNHTAMLFLDDSGRQIVSAVVPIIRANNIHGVLMLSTSPGEIDEAQAEAFEFLWPMVGLALLASLLTSWMLHRTVADPVKQLSVAAEHVSRDINAYTSMPDYTDRKDEVGQMSKAFNAMTASLYGRIEASERFAADVAHELKNPLTAASSTAQSLEYARTDEQRAQLVGQIQSELKRLNRLITDVSSASRLDAELARQQQEPVDLRSVLASVLSIFEDKAERHGVRLSLEFSAAAPDAFTVNGNDGRLGQVFTNLVDNALSFSVSGRAVAIAARLDGDDVIVEIEDEGPGIDEDKLATIFDRFYTYRPTQYTSRGNNSGLGLSITREIIKAHGGRIWAENRYPAGLAQPSGTTSPGDRNTERPRSGARFVVTLPVLRQSTRGGPAGSRRS
ncbi:MAG: stimulus-sensing domain-containing protein [Hyphomicrobiaceae bacterium]|nr:stimulus-sensing domain-containing protein [Hyphomicrobiaceae bacterium]